MERSNRAVPPLAEKRPHVTELPHGVKTEDPFFYLREREDPKVLEYIEAENKYTEEILAHTVPLQEKLFDEMRQYVADEDADFPTPRNGFVYYARCEKGEEYVKHCRKPILCESVSTNNEPKEEILLDCVKLAADSDFLDIGFLDVSPDTKLLAYAADFTGDERFQLRCKNLITKEEFEDIVEDVMVCDVEGGVVWSNDSEVLYYVKQDDSARPYQLLRHKLGTSSSEDELLFHEKDDRFRLKLYDTLSGKFIVLCVAETLAYDYFLIDANDSKSSLRKVHSRESVGVIVPQVDHHSDSILFLHNAQGAKNFKISSSPINDTKMENWNDVVQHQPDIYITHMDVFKDFLLVHERFGGCARLRICKIIISSTSSSFVTMTSSSQLVTESIHLICGREAAFNLTSAQNWEFDTKKYRYCFDTFNTPPCLFEIDMESGKETLLRRKPTAENFRSEDYQIERLWAPSRDGLKIPLSVVYKKDLIQKGKPAKCLLYGYGAYGDNRDPWWDPSRIPIYNRGFVYVFAHVRGGGEMGYWWRENGKFMHKMNTFNDFIDSAQFLVREQWTTSDLLAINGISAGGLLVCAVTNMAPKLFRVVVADVPFTDAIQTMLDETIPLTACEWSEWGNPKDETQYKYMMQWSPCDTIKSDSIYPSILATSGMNDSRVQYWEPLKWIAKLRDKVIADPQRPILIRTEMGGHSGPSGRFEFLRAEAFEMAFIIDQLGSQES